MTDPPTPREADHHSVARPPTTPRWVKGLAIAIMILALVVLVAMLMIGGEHGPGRHA